jgi:endoglucanase
LVRFKVGDVNTVPEGGICKDCYNDFGRDIVVTEEWSEFSTKFSEMKQEPYWGEPRSAIDQTRIYQLQWQVKDRNPFDIWVDDVRLFGCGSEQ